MRMIRQFWSWLRRLVGTRPTPYRTVEVEDFPDRFRAEEIYLVGENGQFWCAALLCPCRCGEVIQINLVTGTRPAWRVEIEPHTGSATLRPSVWRTAGCRSHFVLQRGLVQWCHAVDRHRWLQAFGVSPRLAPADQVDARPRRSAAPRRPGRRPRLVGDRRAD